MASGLHKLGKLISAYRWPIGLAGILLMSIVAQGIMVYFATRPDAPRALPDYYERSLRWDAERAVRDASRQLGWTVTIEIPAGAQYVRGMARPVDVRVRDRNGVAVSGLRGELIAVRPADTRLDTKGTLTELPQEPGRYRTLVRLDAFGVWEMNLDTQKGGTRFVHTQVVDVPAHEDSSSVRRSSGGSAVGSS